MNGYYDEYESQQNDEYWENLRESDQDKIDNNTTFYSTQIPEFDKAHKRIIVNGQKFLEMKCYYNGLDSETTIDTDDRTLTNGDDFDDHDMAVCVASENGFLKDWQTVVLYMKNHRDDETLEVYYEYFDELEQIISTDYPEMKGAVIVW